MDENAPTLPGVDVDATTKGDAGLRAAALATLTTLEDSGLLTRSDALVSQLVLVLAEQAGRGLLASKVTIATTNMLRQLVELVDKLPKADDEVSDAAAQFLAALAAAEAEAKAGR